MNLGLSIIYIRKITMYEYWDNYAKPKYGDKAKICYVDKDRMRNQKTSMTTLQKKLSKDLTY